MRGENKNKLWPVGDVLHVGDGVINAPFLGTEDDAVQVPVDHRRTEPLKLSNQPVYVCACVCVGERDTNTKSLNKVLLTSESEKSLRYESSDLLITDEKVMQNI